MQVSAFPLHPVIPSAGRGRRPSVSAETLGCQADHSGKPRRVNKAGANRSNYLLVDEAVDVVRFLLHTGNNVKLGPEILLSIMRNPMMS